MWHFCTCIVLVQIQEVVAVIPNSRASFIALRDFKTAVENIRTSGVTLMQINSSTLSQTLRMSLVIDV